jgi:hypothetical protein
MSDDKDAFDSLIQYCEKVLEQAGSPEKPKDRTGLVQINKDGIITGWKFDEVEG